ncbi:MAG: type III pantothenate kinase [Pseudomonadota bacterium]
MLLAIDVGNTNAVFAIYDDMEQKTRWRISTDPRRTADEYAVWLQQLFQLEGLDCTGIDAVIISTVVPRALHNLSLLSEKYFGLEPLIAGKPPVQWGILVDVDQPDSLGADRAVNAIGAHARHDGDLIIIDFGTATTLDFIDYSGAYKGGIIAPGINLSLDALVNAAAKLPRIAIEAPEDDNGNVLGRNTEEQMHIGVFWGYVALMEGLIARMKAQIGRPAKVIATGGLAVLFDAHTEIFDSIEPDLTMFGLALLATRVGPGAAS